MGSSLQKRRMSTFGQIDVAHANILTKYGGKVEWLKDTQFLKELEGDSVDTEILDEELQLLHERQPRTCRGKTVKLLEASPIQIALCVLILLDAGVVIAEILLDLHAIRSHQRMAASELFHAMDFLREQFPEECAGYSGDDMRFILDRIRAGLSAQNLSSNASYQDQYQHRFKRDTVDFGANPASRHFQSMSDDCRLSTRAEVSRFVCSMTSHDDAFYDVTMTSLGCDKTTSGDITDNLLRLIPVNMTGDIVLPRDRSALKLLGQVIKVILGNFTLEKFRLQTNSNNDDNLSVGNNLRINLDKFDSATQSDLRPEEFIGKEELPNFEGVARKIVRSAGRVKRGAENSGGKSYDWYEMDEERYRRHAADNYHAEKLLKIAHILHYCSIAILGIFVIQVFLRIFGMGAEFFKNRLEVFDGIIIMASFALDLVFVEGITGAQGEEAIALIIVFLLWRILRVINGIMVTNQQRQEFRIRLQKRAVKRAEKKIESLDDQISWKEKEIYNLKQLCRRKGVTEEDIFHCKPAKRHIHQKVDTAAGLSSIASLSLGFTMSLRAAASSTSTSHSRESEDLKPPAFTPANPFGPFAIMPARHRSTPADHGWKRGVSMLGHSRSSLFGRCSSSSLNVMRSHSMEKIKEEKTKEKNHDKSERSFSDRGNHLRIPSSSSTQSFLSASSYSLELQPTSSSPPIMQGPVDQDSGPDRPIDGAIQRSEISAELHRDGRVISTLGATNCDTTIEVVEENIDNKVVDDDKGEGYARNNTDISIIISQPDSPDMYDEKFEKDCSETPCDDVFVELNDVKCEQTKSQEISSSVPQTTSRELEECTEINLEKNTSEISRVNNNSADTNSDHSATTSSYKSLNSPESAEYCTADSDLSDNCNQTKYSKRNENNIESFNEDCRSKNESWDISAENTNTEKQLKQDSGISLKVTPNETEKDKSAEGVIVVNSNLVNIEKSCDCDTNVSDNKFTVNETQSSISSIHNLPSHAQSDMYTQAAGLPKDKLIKISAEDTTSSAGNENNPIYLEDLKTKISGCKGANEQSVTHAVCVPDSALNNDEKQNNSENSVNRESNLPVDPNNLVGCADSINSNKAVSTMHNISNKILGSSSETTATGEDISANIGSSSDPKMAKNIKSSSLTSSSNHSKLKLHSATPGPAASQSAGPASSSCQSASRPVCLVTKNPNNDTDKLKVIISNDIKNSELFNVDSVPNITSPSREIPPRISDVNEDGNPPFKGSSMDGEPSGQTVNSGGWFKTLWGAGRRPERLAGATSAVSPPPTDRLNDGTGRRVGWTSPLSQMFGRKKTKTDVTYV